MAISDGVKTDVLQDLRRRRGERLSDLMDEYEEEPIFDNLREASQGLVVGVGDPMARIMFVGFSPGAEEDRTGVPFTGQTGELLDELLQAIQQSRKTVYVTNVLKYRIDTKVEKRREFDKDPRRARQVSTSMRYLRKEIAVVKPWVLVLLGSDVLREFDPKKQLSSCHGKIINKSDRYIVPMYHPSSVIRDQSKKQVMMTDIEAVGRAFLAFENG